MTEPTTDGSGFVHLHVHAENSQLDGLARVKSIAKTAAALGQKALALTDHGSLAGAWKFQKNCVDAGIKPIIGCEMYMSIGSRHERNFETVVNDDDNASDADEGKEKVKRYMHLTVLARNEAGWKNLLALHNKAEDSYWYKPRIDFDLLDEHGDGLIILTGCLGGPVAGPLARAGKAEKDAEQARNDVATFQELAREVQDPASVAHQEAVAAGEDVEQLSAAHLAAAATKLVLFDELTAQTVQGRAEARANLNRLIKAVGREHVFIEVMYHGIKAEAHAFRELRALSEETGIPLVATNDCHYEHAEDAPAHDGLLAVGVKRSLDDPNRFRFNGTPDYYVKSEAEMLAVLGDIKNEAAAAAWREAVANTVKVAALCADTVIPAPKMRLPKFPVPAGFADERAFLHHLVKEGAKERFGATLPQAVKERLRTEEDIICDMGFPAYFLIVWDIIAWARSDYSPQDWIDVHAGKPVNEETRTKKKPILVGVGRGSAAGSMISYCLKIVGVDPIENHLLFERFLEPGRQGMPDIDVDFEAARRAEVFGYTAIRWGGNMVAHIGTFGMALSKAAIKDAARILKPSATDRDANMRGAALQKLGNQLSDMIPSAGGKAYSFAQLDNTADNATEAFRDLVSASGQDAQDILTLARAFEGITKTESIHACGFIISPEPLTDIVPMRWQSHTANADPNAPRVICWDGGDCEELGLLKMDILGLTNLDIAAQSLDYIKATTGNSFTVEEIPHPSTKGNKIVDGAYALMAAGKTAGIFQMECVTGETFVGGRRIDELYRRQATGEIGGSTLSYYLDEGVARRNGVKKIIKSGNKDVFRLVTDSGRMIEATASHLFMTEKSGWEKLEDIATGMRVLVDQKAKTRVHRTCLDCPATLDSLASNKPTRCYRCSATFHANPKSSQELIRAGIKAGYDAGRVTWNHGLTIENSEVMAATGRKISAANAGKTWEEIYGAQGAAAKREELSAKMSGRGNHMFGKPTKHAKGGFRADLGHYVRSSWEADYARVLNYLGETYEYEKRTFELMLDDGREVTYTPDFFLPRQNRFVEIKGFMRELDAMKIAKFIETHPEYDFELVSATLFAELQMKFQDLVDWECPVTPARSSWETVVEIIPVGMRETFDISMQAPAHNYLANGFMVHNSGGMIKIAQSIVPESLDDVSAIVALFRPGPLKAGMDRSYAARKSGAETVSYTDFTNDPVETKWIDTVLGATYGMAIYQETIMRLSTVVAGFDATKRSRLRKAMGKKKQSEMDACLAMWTEGATQEFFGDDGEMISPRFAPATAAKLWDFISGAASYLFNASHSAAYGQLAYITAYLKSGWPVEYSASILAVADKDEKRLTALAALRDDGIAVLAPDVNKSMERTAPVDGQVLLGLSEIKDVGSNGVHIVRERIAGGPFTSLADLVERVQVPSDMTANGFQKVPAAALQGLVEAGALDEFGPRLGQLMSVRAVGKNPQAPIVDARWDSLEEATRQRQRLGVSLGIHPLVSKKDKLSVWATPGVYDERTGESVGTRPTPLHKISDDNGAPVVTLGVISMWEEKAYGGGRRANFSLESSRESINGVIWDRTLSGLRRKGIVPKIGDIVAVSGKVNVRSTVIGDEESGTEETIKTKELNIFEMWPVATGDKPDVPLEADSNVVSFADLYQKLRTAAPTPPEPPKGKGKGDSEDDATADEEMAPVVVLEDRRQEKARLEPAFVHVGDLGTHTIGNRMVSGPSEIVNKFTSAALPDIKNIQPGNIFRCDLKSGHKIYVLVRGGVMNPAEMAEYVRGVDDESRWVPSAAKETPNGIQGWFRLVEATAKPATAQEDVA